MLVKQRLMIPAEAQANPDSRSTVSACHTLWHTKCFPQYIFNTAMIPLKPGWSVGGIRSTTEKKRQERLFSRPCLCDLLGFEFVKHFVDVGQVVILAVVLVKLAVFNETVQIFRNSDFKADGVEFLHYL